MADLAKPAFVNVTNFPHANREENYVLALGSVSVPDNTLTTVATLAANGVRFITKIIGSGQYNGEWEVHINSVMKIRKRANGNTVEFPFENPLKIPASTVLDVKVSHLGGSALDFDSSIIGFEES